MVTIRSAMGQPRSRLDGTTVWIERGPVYVSFPQRGKSDVPEVSRSSGFVVYRRLLRIANFRDTFGASDRDLWLGAVAAISRAMSVAFQSG